MDFTIESNDMTLLANSLKRYNILTRLGVRKVMNLYVNKLRSEVIKNASGRPGPRRITGQYTSSIQTQRAHRSQSEYSVSVWTDHPAAHRLEYGYIGTDSLGRHYAQPPYPHFGPALSRLEPELARDLHRELIKAWGLSGGNV